MSQGPESSLFRPPSLLTALTYEEPGGAAASSPAFASIASGRVGPLLCFGGVSDRMGRHQDQIEAPSDGLV